MSIRRFTFFTLAFVAVVADSRQLISQSAPSIPRVEVTSASRLRLPGEIDSNSPALWQRIGGLNQLLVFTSFAGQPSLSMGPQLDRLSAPLPVVIDPWPGDGVWLEAVVPDVDGTLYGYYHNEVPASMCPASGKVIPRIGAVRSTDNGRTWTPLGVILQAPPGTFDCSTNDVFFVGGVGDFSVQLDVDSRDLYFFYSQYTRRATGVGVARLAWADRDNPVGKVMVYTNGVWLPARSFVFPNASVRWFYPQAAPIFPALDPFHGDDTRVNAFWGPSVHWNVYLEQYVMLLNHAKDTNWTQEGIYVSFNRRLDDPAGWSVPVKILNGGRWYPQVMGLEAGSGTDKVAGRRARLFMSGTSDHTVQFIK